MSYPSFTRTLMVLIGMGISSVVGPVNYEAIPIHNFEEMGAAADLQQMVQNSLGKDFSKKVTIEERRLHCQGMNVHVSQKKENENALSGEDPSGFNVYTIYKSENRPIQNTAVGFKCPAASGSYSFVVVLPNKDSVLAYVSSIPEP